MKRIISRVLRGLSAIVLMLFATNFLPVAAAFADQPTGVGNNLAPVSTGATSPLDYTGQGIPVDQQCDDNNTPYLLFIFTYGGNYNPTNVTLHGITVQSQSEMGNETHFTTDYVDPTTLINKVNVSWSGEVGNSPQLVISHGCAGSVTPPTDVCKNIEGVQTEVPEGMVKDGDDCVTPPTDVCANIAGVQTEVPEGKILVDEDQCVTPPTDVCKNIEGVQTEVPEGMVKEGDNCVTPPTDVCKNIPGNQATVPEGMTVNDNGICKDVKVFVCKYVGTPGVDERLQTGQNPISVSVNSTGGAAVGSYFNDAQGRSFVLAIDNTAPGPEGDPDVSACPHAAPTAVTPAVSFNEPSCENTSGRATVTAMAGVTYKVNGATVTGTTSYAAGSSVTVTAVIASGFVLASGAHDSFSHTFGSVPTGCVLGATDVCPNIAGDQATVPAGMTKDTTTGNCVTTQIGRGGGGEVLGATTVAAASPTQLANTGQSPWAAIIVGLTVLGLTLSSAFVTRKQHPNA